MRTTTTTMRRGDDCGRDRLGRIRAPRRDGPEALPAFPETPHVTGARAPMQTPLVAWRCSQRFLFRLQRFMASSMGNIPFKAIFIYTFTSIPRVIYTAQTESTLPSMSFHGDFSGPGEVTDRQLEIAEFWCQKACSACIERCGRRDDTLSDQRSGLAVRKRRTMLWV